MIKLGMLRWRETITPLCEPEATTEVLLKGKPDGHSEKKVM